MKSKLIKYLSIPLMAGSFVLAGCNGEEIEVPKREDFQNRNDIGIGVPGIASEKIRLRDYDNDGEVDALIETSSYVPIFIRKGVDISKIGNYSDETSLVMDSKSQEAVDRLNQALKDTGYELSRQRYEARNKKE